jgi:hypothetical protein
MSGQVFESSLYALSQEIDRAYSADAYLRSW